MLLLAAIVLDTMLTFLTERHFASKIRKPSWKYRLIVYSLIFIPFYSMLIYGFDITGWSILVCSISGTLFGGFLADINKEGA